MKTKARWVVEYDESEYVIRRQSFIDYEDAVIKAKVTGENRVFDSVELVWIEL